MTEPRRGEQVSATIAERLEHVFAWKVLDRRGDWWGWWSPTQQRAFGKFIALIDTAGYRFADRSITDGSPALPMVEALALVADAIDQIGQAKDHGIAIAKAATFLRFVQPRLVLVASAASAPPAEVPPADQMSIELADAERKAATKWSEAERKRKTAEWYEAHRGDEVAPKARTWVPDDDWREQE